MSTTVALPVAVAAAARRRRAALIRAIGRRRPGTRLHFVCEACETSWSGAEHDCWLCSLPATTEYTHRGSALQLLLERTRPTNRPRRERR